MLCEIKENADDFINGEYEIYKDTTLMYSTFKAQFQLLLGEGYHISLDVEKETGKCIGLCATLAALKFRNTNLQLNSSKRATLLFDCNALQDSGHHYLPFENACHCDKEQCVLAFGNIAVSCPLFETSKNTFVGLKDGKLVVVYIKLSKDVFQCFKF